MKLLLTSGGLRNQELQRVFLSMLTKPIAETSIAVIPTAARNETDKDWFVKDMQDLKSTGVGRIEMVEIAELSKADWLEKLENADVIFVEGGDVYYLRDQAVKTDFAKELPRLLESKLYVGVSAGTRLLNPDISIAALYYDATKDPRGLGLTNFCVVPHMNSARFKDRTSELVEPKVKNFPYTTYLIDDDTAILTDGSTIEFVGGGRYVQFKK